MSARECPSDEDLARFAESGPARNWRSVVRHVADCALCRRQVEILRLTADEPFPRATIAPPLPAPAVPPVRRWHRAAQAIAAAALLALLLWAVLGTRPGQPIREQAAPKAPPRKIVTSTPQPPPPLDIPREPDAPPPLPPVPQEEKVATPAPNLKPLPAIPPPTPFLAQRARSEVSQELEVAAADGAVSIVSGDTVQPLAQKATVKPSDTLVAPTGGSFSLPDGTRLHLSGESEVKVAWSQTLACASIDLRKGDAIVDLGAQPRPIHVVRGAVGVRLQESSGRLWVASDGDALRATPLTGSARFPTPSGAGQDLDLLQSLVLGEKRDTVERAAAPPVLAPRFPTLDAVVRAPEPPPPPAPKLAPAPENVLLALAAQNYSYRVVGRQTREGVWASAGVATSTLDEFLAVRKLGDKKPAHVRRGTRPWDDLGPIVPGTREAKLLEIVKNAQPPHLTLLEMVPTLRAESAVRTEQIGDRICYVWDRALDAASLRETAEQLFALAVQEGRIQAPDFIYWDTLQGSLEFAATKIHGRLVRVVDRRKVSYSYKTFGGLDRKWYHLETVYEFSEHGHATLKLPVDMIRELIPGKK